MQKRKVLKARGFRASIFGFIPNEPALRRQWDEPDVLCKVGGSDSEAQLGS